MKKNKKNNLDERQEQALLRIEHNGCWIAFWGLFVVFIGEQIIYGFDFKTVGGEWLVFMILALYISFACMKEGIWDRRLKPNFKTNLVVSLIAGVVTTAIIGDVVLGRYPDKPVGALASGAIIGVITFVLCLISLSIMAAKTKKVLEKQEEEEEF
ncbi:MAG: hypothetical protein MJ097_00040 [Dorea sp.]|nr:hypothetical protein [Dorea sp.]